MIKFRYIIIISIFISCSDYRNIDNEVMKCFNTKLNEKNKENSNNLFKYLKDIELYSKNNGYLKGSNKNAYLNFYEDLYRNKQKAKEYAQDIQNSIINEYYFNLGIIFSYYKNCHIGIIQPDENYDKKEIDKANKKLRIFDKLESNSFNDYDSFLFLIENTNFKNEKEKLLLLNTIVIYSSLSIR